MPVLKFSPPKGNPYAKILVIGDAGAGKTHFGMTFPDPYFIDTEGGVGFFANRFQFKDVHTRSYADIMDTLKYFEKNGVPF